MSTTVRSGRWITASTWALGAMAAALWLYHLLAVFDIHHAQVITHARKGVVLESASTMVLLKMTNGGGESQSGWAAPGGMAEITGVPLWIALTLTLMAAAGAVAGYVFSAVGGRVGAALRWPVVGGALAAAWALLMTAGTFVLLNDVAVWAVENGPTAKSALKARHTLRDAFLHSIGRVEMPEKADGPELRAFLSAHPNLETLARRYDPKSGQLAPATTPAAPTGTPPNESSLSNLPAPSDGVQYDKVKPLLDLTDADLWNLLASQLKLQIDVLAKPANHWAGYSDPGASLIREEPRPSLRPHTADQVNARAVAVTGAANDDDKRAMAGVLAELVMARVDAVEGAFFPSIARRANGVVQFLGILPFFLGVALIARRWPDRTSAPLARLNGHLARNPLLKDDGAVGTVAARALHAIIQADAAEPGVTPGQRLADEQLLKTLRAFLANGDPMDADRAVESHRELALNGMFSEHGMLRYVVWVIPLVGFLGTLIGIGNGLLKANALVDPSVESASALQGVVSELGLAFDITALLASMVLMLAFYSLQRREEQTILLLSDAITRKVVHRLERRGWFLDRVEMAFAIRRRADTGELAPIRRDANGAVTAQYAVRVIELFGRDPHRGYVKQDPTRLSVRLSKLDPADPTPDEGWLMEVVLGPQYFTPMGIRQFVVPYFAWPTTRPALLSPLRTWFALFPDDFREELQQIDRRLEGVRDEKGGGDGDADGKGDADVNPPGRGPQATTPTAARRDDHG